MGKCEEGFLPKITHPASRAPKSPHKASRSIFCTSSNTPQGFHDNCLFFWPLGLKFIDQTTETQGNQGTGLGVGFIQLVVGTREKVHRLNPWAMCAKVTHHYYSPSTGQNSVTWSYWTARETGKCSLAINPRGKENMVLASSELSLLQVLSGALESSK